MLSSAEMAMARSQRLLSSPISNDPVFRDFVAKHLYLHREDQSDRKITERVSFEMFRCWMDLIQKYPSEVIDSAFDAAVADV